MRKKRKVVTVRVASIRGFLRALERWRGAHPFFPGRVEVRRSRRVLAETLGRPLKRNEVAHHRNESTLDDRPGNLELLTVGEHVRRHRTGAVMSASARRKISAALAGRPSHWKGKARSIETRRKMHLAKLGHPVAPWTREKMRRAMLARLREGR